MPADVLAELDGGVSFAVGFWRFVLSPSYRAAVRGRWRARRRAMHLVSAGEALLATALGLLAPLAIVAMLVVTARR